MNIDLIQRLRNCADISKSLVLSATLIEAADALDAVYTAAQVQSMLAAALPSAQEPFGYFKPEPFGWTDCAETDEGAIALYEAPQPHQITEPAGNATPSVKGIYAWVPENGPPALLHVNKRPSSHSPGGILNAHVLQSPSFYDGCPVSQWGPGCWILLRSFEIPKEQS